LLDAPRKILGFSWAAMEGLRSREAKKAIKNPKRLNILPSAFDFT
jgi:hypothetical protein